MYATQKIKHSTFTSQDVAQHSTDNLKHKKKNLIFKSEGENLTVKQTHRFKFYWFHPS